MERLLVILKLNIDFQICFHIVFLFKMIVKIMSDIHHLSTNQSSWCHC